MQVALINVCVDERLNHELLRIQVRNRMAGLHINAKRIFIVNEIGGNLGENFKNTLDLVHKLGDEVVFTAASHHDDCRAEKVGLRLPLEETVKKMGALLAERSVFCALASANIYTNNSLIVWLKELRLEAAPPSESKLLRGDASVFRRA